MGVSQRLMRAQQGVDRRLSTLGRQSTLKIDATGTSASIKKEFRKLNALAKAAVTTKVKNAMVKTANPVLEAVKAATPVEQYGRTLKRYDRNGGLADVYEPGNLRKSMRIFKGTLNNTNAPAIFIGPHTGRHLGRIVEDDGYYLLFLLYGTSGPYGSIEPNNFMARVKNQKKSFIRNNVGKAAAKAVELHINKNL